MEKERLNQETSKPIMVIAGTKDARKVAELLLTKGRRVMATVTTPYGRELLSQLPGLEVHEGKLSEEALKALVLEKEVEMVVDASHPFAEEVSRNAMKACLETGVVYLRFEREETPWENLGDVTPVYSFEEAAQAMEGVLAREKGNAFLAIGTNHLPVFTEKREELRHRIFARILPDSRMVVRCEAAGLATGNILAMKGPFSESLNLEMMKYCQAAVLVTKESGDTGGTREKLQAAKKLGIPVILVKRPRIHYPEQVRSLEALAAFLEHHDILSDRCDDKD